MSKEFTNARHVACKAIKSDPEILAFMTTNFPGKTLTVRREIPPGFFPGEESLPLVGWGVSTHNRSDKDPHLVEHAAPLGIYLSMEGAEVVEDGDGVQCMNEISLLDELGGLVERVASKALTDNGFPFDQDPYLPDDADWTQYFMSFRLYRVRETSYL